MSLQNDLILRAARGEKTERTPVWLMRQAGRILPEYRAVRASLSGFKELVTTPELACEVTIQPVDLLGVDAAIIFSDILVIPEALGLDYEMIKGKGPFFPETIKTEADVAKLRSDSPADHLGYVTDAISLTKKELNGRVPLIGFAGAPWTIFCYMIEGEGSKTFSKARRMLMENETLAHGLLQRITDATIAYLKAQVRAGADMLQLFDSWAGVLSAELYQKFAMPYIQQIATTDFGVPFTQFSKGAWFAFDQLAKLPVNTLGVDWNTPIAWAREHANGKTLQGNLDPAVLYADEETLVKKTKEMLAAFEGHPHIANLGHGVYPDTNPDHVRIFIETVKNYQTPK